MSPEQCHNVPLLGYLQNFATQLAQTHIPQPRETDQNGENSELRISIYTTDRYTVHTSFVRPVR